MDEVAERGIAAHWRYKGVNQGGQTSEMWLQRLRELMEDDTAVAELYAAMDVSEVEELLQKVMLYADLEGRVVEDG